MQGVTALTHLFAGRFDEASMWAEKAVRELPSFLAGLTAAAASHALAGRGKGSEIELCNSSANLLRRSAFRTSKIGCHFVRKIGKYSENGLRKAGLPE